jgi:hypothetical protein
MKLTLRVDYQGQESYTVSTNLHTVVLWERKYRTKASKLAEGIGMEDLAYLAYESAKAAGVECPVVFDDYLKHIDNIEVIEDEPVNPM